MDLAQRPLAEIASACRAETEKFLRNLPSCADYCYELFRRAICQRDQPAWEAVLAQYRGIVLSWVRQHSAASSLREDDEYWINRAFTRFWGAIGADRFSRFETLAALLKYLKMCVNSVLLDDMRARAVAQVESLDEQPAEQAGNTVDAEVMAVGRLAGGELWQTIAAEIADEAERVVVYLSFALDMKPAEIFERYRALYASVGDVYRIKRNVLERLRRSPAIQTFLR